MTSKAIRAVATVFFLFFSPLLFCADRPSPIEYEISLKDAAHHIVNVSVHAEATGQEMDFQLPVWNGLYQIRDFAKNIITLSAQDATGKALKVRKLDKTTWRLGRPGSEAGPVEIKYRIIADQPGPFGAELTPEHGFFNLAEVLGYPVGQRDHPIAVSFKDVPAEWKLATALQEDGPSPTSQTGDLLHARNYDALVDSPCELGRFREFDFEQGGAKYRVAIDADPKDYKPEELIRSLKKITAAEIDWMGERPFDHYLFIYHFPEGAGGGGMEHAYSTAISTPAAALENLSGFESVSAHEFFHLWNVKRIRPATLEPIDYTRENYTRALWFSEGVTTTAADLARLKAGLLTEKEYLAKIGAEITTLEERPAHLTQSAEESSLDTWLDGYAVYRAPERSISYYNKGDILGVLLDLKIREDSRDRKSLRDLFQSMDQNYAKRGRYFADSDGVRSSAEALTATDLRGFFMRYVAGVEELPYQELFATVGLNLNKKAKTVADAGFTAMRNFDGPMIVVDVTGTTALAAGVRNGDEVVEIEGKGPDQSMARTIGAMTPGTMIHVTLRRGGSLLPVSFPLEAKESVFWALEEMAHITAAQRARRQAWLNSEDEGNAVAPTQMKTSAP